MTVNVMKRDSDGLGDRVEATPLSYAAYAEVSDKEELQQTV